MKDPLYTSDPYLNSPLNEIRRCVMKVKSNKSSRTDMIPNEILKFECVIQVSYDLFNICFDYGIIPEKWFESIIFPIIKSKNRDPRKPENYRGISLLSCIAKVNVSVLNNRLMKYLKKKLNALTDIFKAFINLKSPLIVLIGAY